ncbi:Nn.00g081720.m01.CDS01 [Neocucurbitaria sp. VM-36]
MPAFDLKKNLVFYGAYHRDPANVAIHIACVPILLATGFLFGTNTPTLPIRQPRLLTRLNLPLNLGTLAAVTYSTLYLLLSPNLAGISITPLVLGAASLANRLTTKYNTTKVNTIAIGVHVVSWILQFIGHGKYEGRKPALLDNLVQALFLAPLFVWYEVLFKLGFYKELRRDVESAIDVEVAKLKKGKENETE